MNATTHADIDHMASGGVLVPIAHHVPYSTDADVLKVDVLIEEYRRVHRGEYPHVGIPVQIVRSAEASS